MGGNIKHIIVFLTILIASTVAGWRTGLISDSGHPEHVVVTVSGKSGVAGTPITVRLRNEREGISSISAFGYPSHNVSAFAFPPSGNIDSLSVSIDPNEQVEISAITVASGSFLKTYSGDQVGEAFMMENATSSFKNGVLSLKKTENASINLNLKEALKISSASYNSVWGIFCGIAFLIVLLLLYRLRKSTLRHWARALFFSSGIALFAGYILLQLREEVRNADVVIRADSQKADRPLDLYYSSNGGFESSKILTTSLPAEINSQAGMKLPDTIHRHLRVDIPKNDTFLLKEILLDGWMFSKSFSQKEIREKFPLMNDLEYDYTPEGDLMLYTGGADPYLQWAGEAEQKKFAFLQQKKIDYPEWLALLIFIALMMLFTTKQSSKQLVFASVFGLFLIIPGVSFILKQDKIRLDTEKRLAAQAPGKCEDFQELTIQTNDYLNDQFGGRTGLITSWNILKVMSYNQTSHSSPVVIGDDEWMYYKAEGVQETYENKQPLTQDTLRKMADVLEERQEWLALQGIDYYIVFPPIKHTIYEEYLPPRFRRYYRESKLDQLINYLRENTTINVIDVRPTLLAAKGQEKGPIYYRFDSHWNLLGGYYAYAEIMDAIRKDHPNIPVPKKRSDYEWSESKTEEGDLVKLLSLNSYFLRSEVVPFPYDGYKAEHILSEHYPTYESIHDPITYAQKDTTLPTLAMNRDSYSNFLIPYMSEHFSRSVYLWTPLFNAEVIRTEQPDIFVTEMLERFIGDLTIDNPPVMKQDIQRWKSERNEAKR